MQIADVQESIPMTRDMYVGVENFYPVAVNPTLKELNDMGIPATETPVYFGKIERNGVEYDYFSIRIFLDNKDSLTPIKTQVQYTILRDYQVSSTGKFKVINKFGSDSWLEDPTGPLPENMKWYVADGVKKCYRGEENLIAFIRALRNLPNISVKSTKEQKDNGISHFTDEDLNKMFNGNFNDIRNVIIDGTNESKVGFLLGVKFQDDKPRQTLYSRMPLKSYIRATNNTDYLINDVKSAQDNGSMSDVIFDLNDTKLKVYDIDSINPSDNSDLSEEDDDLPF